MTLNDAKSLQDYTNGDIICRHAQTGTTTDGAIRIDFDHDAGLPCPFGVLNATTRQLRRQGVRHVRITHTPKKDGKQEIEYLKDLGYSGWRSDILRLGKKTKRVFGSRCIDAGWRRAWRTQYSWYDGAGAPGP
jgi:hypothetical protein